MRHRHQVAGDAYGALMTAYGAHIPLALKHEGRDRSFGKAACALKSQGTIPHAQGDSHRADI